MPAPCGFFLCLAMCLRMYETKLHCPRRNTFVWSSFWGRLLFRSGEAYWPNAKEKPSLYRGSWQKYITQYGGFLPDTSSDTFLDREKKQGSGFYREAAIVSSFWGRLLFFSGEACWPKAKEKPSLYRGSWQKYITQGGEFLPDTSSDT